MCFVLLKGYYTAFFIDLFFFFLFVCFFGLSRILSQTLLIQKTVRKEMGPCLFFSTTYSHSRIFRYLFAIYASEIRLFVQIFNSM